MNVWKEHHGMRLLQMHVGIRDKNARACMYVWKEYMCVMVAHMYATYFRLELQALNASKHCDKLRLKQLTSFLQIVTNKYYDFKKGMTVTATTVTVTVNIKVTMTEYLF